MAIAESDIAKRMARDVPVEQVLVLDDDGQPE